MNHRKIVRAVMCATLLCSALAIPVTSASASDSSIRATLKSYNPRLIVDEGHVITALGEYKTSGTPTAVQAALVTYMTSLRSLRSAIAKQSAGRPNVKAGKAKLEQGLQGIIVAYTKLNVALGEHKGSPEAKTELANASIAVDKARTELAEGAKLLR
jgi:hypothetical protein